MWAFRHKPLTGDCEYGRHTFHDMHGLSSTAQEKATVIDQYLKAINVFNQKVEESRNTLAEEKLRARTIEAKSVKNKLRNCAAVAGGVLAVTSVAHCILSAVRGNGGGHIPKPDIPGHVVVGGGHMELPTHISVGGGI